MASSSSPQLRDLISVEMDPAAFRQYLLQNGYDESVINDIGNVDFREMVAQEIQRRMALLRSASGKRAPSPGRRIGEPSRRAPSPTRRALSPSRIEYDNALKEAIRSMDQQFQKLIDQIENGPDSDDAVRLVTSGDFYRRNFKTALINKNPNEIELYLLEKILDLMVRAYKKIQATGVPLLSEYLDVLGLDDDINAAVEAGIDFDDPDTDFGKYVRIEHGLHRANTEAVAEMVVNALNQLYPAKLEKIAEVELTHLYSPTVRKPHEYKISELVLLKRYGNKYLNSQRAVELFNSTLENDLALERLSPYGFQNLAHSDQFYREVLKHINYRVVDRINLGFLVPLGHQALADELRHGLNIRFPPKI